MNIFLTESSTKLDSYILLVGGLVGGYGLLQHFGIDAIHWDNPYNSVLSTLGNPDFASAVMGIFLVLAVGMIIRADIKTIRRIIAGLIALILFATILFSQARQGLLAAMLGLGLLVAVFVWQRNKVLSATVLGLGFAGLVLGMWGMLNHGPFARYLFKTSIPLRGDYWRAGIHMFKSNPFFGVGLDRYGANFRSARDLKQALRNGPDTISNAAHNVPIQIAATGGIFLLVTYLILIFYIGHRSYVAIKNRTGYQQLSVAAVVGAWITYEAQSIISIDNIGISIWGWVLGGMIVGISLQGRINSEPSKNKTKQLIVSGSNITQPLVSGLLLTAAIALVVPLYLADSSARLARYYKLPEPNQTSAYLAAASKPLKYGFQDPDNQVLAGALYAQAGHLDEV